MVDTALELLEISNLAYHDGMTESQLLLGALPFFSGLLFALFQKMSAKAGVKSNVQKSKIGYTLFQSDI